MTSSVRLFNLAVPNAEGRVLGDAMAPYKAKKERFSSVTSVLRNVELTGRPTLFWCPDWHNSSFLRDVILGIVDKYSRGVSIPTYSDRMFVATLDNVLRKVHRGW